MSHIASDDGSRGRTVAIVLLTLAFVGGIVAMVRASDDAGPTTAARKVLGMSPERRLPAVEPPDGGGPFAFMQTTRDGEPVGFDPCRTITVRINPRGAPPGQDAVVQQALYDLGNATGLEIVRGEDTDERPALTDVGAISTTYQAGSTEDPTVVVIWSRKKETPPLKGRTVGVGGSTAYSVGDARPYYGRGAVALDRAPLTEALLRGDGFRRVTAVLEHELGHVLGLDHVRANDELMNASNLGRLELGPGDRTGLAELGAIPCA